MYPTQRLTIFHALPSCFQDSFLRVCELGLQQACKNILCLPCFCTAHSQEVYQILRKYFFCSPNLACANSSPARRLELKTVPVQESLISSPSENQICIIIENNVFRHCKPGTMMFLSSFWQLPSGNTSSSLASVMTGGLEGQESRSSRQIPQSTPCFVSPEK